MAEIKLTNANAMENFISFSVDGLKDQLQVGITGDPNSHGQALSIAYKGQVYVFPFSANSKEIKLINAQYDTSEYFNEENPLEDMFENGQQVKIGNLYADKETYEWLTTPSDEDDDVGNWRENTVFTDEPDPKRVEACKKIFEGVEKLYNPAVDFDESGNLVVGDLDKEMEFTYTASELNIMFGLKHYFEIFDELGINKDNFDTFRNVIEEHCFNKGMYGDLEIINVWNKFNDSLKEAVDHTKKFIKK